ncbi:ATP-binding protein [Paradesulfitobacterium aromaticivorans]
MNFVGTEETIELRIPSRAGYEKVAMAVAAVIAKDKGLPEERVDDLTTALAEAVLNAMEHGNSMNAELQVIVTLSIAVDKLLVSITDQGQGFLPPEKTPSMHDKITGDAPARGWGWFLMEQLVDRVEVVAAPSGGTSVRLVVIMEGKDTHE